MQVMWDCRLFPDSEAAAAGRRSAVLQGGSFPSMSSSAAPRQTPGAAVTLNKTVVCHFWTLEDIR